MQCTSPRTVGFQSDGKTLCWSQKTYSKEYATFKLPCGKCIECRLQYAREWAIRCVHEAQMHEKNCFITLTYSDEHLKSPKLVYSDFQKFMKKLRRTQDEPIGMFVTGEYGETTKRPHWHAIVFNWSPRDLTPSRTTDSGDQAYSSRQLDLLWGKGRTELGNVTFKSAGYCARYAAKKLVHGKDDEHDYQPISKKSVKHAIGKKWLEQFFPDVFSFGRVVLKDGTKIPVPRYYEKWFQKNHPDLWERYVTRTKLALSEMARDRALQEEQEWIRNLNQRRDAGKTTPLHPREIRRIIQQKKFEQLQAYLKL